MLHEHDPGALVFAPKLTTLFPMIRVTKQGVWQSWDWSHPRRECAGTAIVIAAIGTRHGHRDIAYLLTTDFMGWDLPRWWHPADSDLEQAPTG